MGQHIFVIRKVLSLGTDEQRIREFEKEYREILNKAKEEYKSIICYCCITDECRPSTMKLTGNLWTQPVEKRQRKCYSNSWSIICEKAAEAEIFI